MTTYDTKIEGEIGALGSQEAMQRTERFDEILGRDVLAFTGDGDTLGITYLDHDEGVTVVWNEGPSCVMMPATGAPTVVRLVTKRGVGGLTQRMCRRASSIRQSAINDYLAAQSSEDAA